MYQGFATFHLSAKRISLSSYHCLAPRFCRFAISGWMSQTVKCTNANNRKVASCTLDARQKLTRFLKSGDLPKHTLEMRTHQRLPGRHQTVQEVLGHLSEYQLCVLIFFQLISQSPMCQSTSSSQFYIVINQFVNPRHSRKLHVRCETRFLSVQTGQNCQLLPPLLQISWPSSLSLPAQHHSIVYWRYPQDERISNCCQCCHPQRLLYHSWQTQMQTHSKLEPEVSASKIPRIFIFVQTVFADLGI